MLFETYNASWLRVNSEKLVEAFKPRAWHCSVNDFEYKSAEVYKLINKNYIAKQKEGEVVDINTL